jgi:hypothetical protein
VRNAGSRAAAELKLSIPSGTEADVSMPKLGLMNIVVSESGTTVCRNNAYVPGAPGLAGGIDTPDSVILRVGCGSYKFAVNGGLL